MVLILLLISVLVFEFLKRLYEYNTGSSPISMRCFKNKNYIPKFNEIYDEIIGNNKDKIKNLKENVRAVQILQYVLNVCGIWFILTGIYLICLCNISDGLILMGLALFMYAGSMWTVKLSDKVYGEYLEKYKETVINDYVRKVNHGFGYSLRGVIEKENFLKSFDEEIEIDHYYGSDYVTGTVEGTRTIHLCELYTKYHNAKNKNIFCGLFGFFKTDYLDEMKVSCENKNLKFKKIPLNMQVKMEKFIKDFLVEQKLDFDLDVKDGRIYLKLYTGDILRPAIFREQTNKERLWAYYLCLKFIVELTGILNTVKVYEEKKRDGSQHARSYVKKALETDETKEKAPRKPRVKKADKETENND
ncbi:MAG: hypothetical protein MJ246_03780 [Clostridia bacterium]|nr:hypothetical protein [Clostridia bacterium]